MRLLLDTHALLWRLSGDARLPEPASAAIDEADLVLVSAASLWELTIKHAQGRLPQVAPLLERLEPELKRAGFDQLPITIRHMPALHALPPHHKDPFDRLLIAQALSEDLVLVSNETLFDRYGVRRLWDASSL